jgi:AraC family transcriptional regulator of adaptative response/methylated-DNA-[protein]-cysteine methyltransferase
MPNDYERIARAIAFLAQHAARQPTLAEVARAAGLSEFHFQRLFRRWAGVSPKRFLQYLAADRAAGALRRGRPVLAAAYDAGLSGPGRLHDLLVSVEAATPGEIRSGGAGLEIRWGSHATPFGTCVLGMTSRGVCHLSFHDGSVAEELAPLRHDWPKARLVRDQRGTATVMHRIFQGSRGRRPLGVHLKGTNFQLKVWEALLRIPDGATTTYGDLAAAIGTPSSARAVGTAVGDNPVAFLIPCHRVLRATGALGGYRWGTDRKQTMLAWEAVRRTG